MPTPSRDVTVSSREREGMAVLENFRSQLPLCLLRNGDLSVNPGLANLLTDLKKYIDSSGMSITLAQPLEETRRMLWLHRASWFKWGTLYCIVWKVVLNLRADSSLRDEKFLETLEQQLIVYDLVLRLSQPKAWPFVLGLETQHLTKFLPPCQDLKQMKKKLLAKVGKSLKASCLQLLSYHHPNNEKVGAATQMIMFGNLAEHLAIEKQHLKEARAREEELNRYLYQLKRFYSQVLLRCLDFLRQLAHKFRLGDQSKLDQFNVQYMEIKSNAFLLKLWLEEMKILLETYTPEVLNVHQIIRDGLQGRLSKEERDVVIFRDVLLQFEILGPEFEKLVDKYTKLHEIIQTRRWMLAELDKY